MSDNKTEPHPQTPRIPPLPISPPVSPRRGVIDCTTCQFDMILPRLPIKDKYIYVKDPKPEPEDDEDSDSSSDSEAYVSDGYICDSKMLGKGAYSHVYVIERDDIAVKKFISMNFAYMNEVAIYGLLQGFPCIASYRGSEIGKKVIYFEKYTETLMHNYYSKTLTSADPTKEPYPYLCMDEYKDNMYKVAKALYILHSRGIMHGDIKPENILYKGSDVVLGDMGICEFLTSSYDNPSFLPTYHEIQTMWYRAPEVIMKQSFDIGVDIWSLAIVFIQYLTDTVIVSRLTPFDQMVGYIEKFGTPTATPGSFVDLLTKGPQIPLLTASPKRWAAIFNKGDSLPLWALDKDYLELLTGMLRYDRSTRFTIVDVINSDFFKSVRIKDIVHTSAIRPLYPNINWVQRLLLRCPGPVNNPEFFLSTTAVFLNKQIEDGIKTDTYWKRSYSIYKIIDVVYRYMLYVKETEPEHAYLTRQIFNSCTDIVKTILDTSDDNYFQTRYYKYYSRICESIPLCIPTELDFMDAIQSTVSDTSQFNSVSRDKVLNLLWAVRRDQLIPYNYTLHPLTKALTAYFVVTHTMYGPAAYFDEGFATLLKGIHDKRA